MAHAELDHGMEIAKLAAAVEAPAGEPHGKHAFLGEQSRNRIGELDLAAGAGCDGSEELEDARREHVAADDREVRGRFRGLWLLDDAVDARAVALHPLHRDDAVALGLIARHLFDAEQRTGP